MRRVVALAVGALTIIALPVSASAVNYTSAVHSGLLHEIHTEEYYYWLPDDVHITYTVTNVSGAPIEIGWAWCCSPLRYGIYNSAEILIWADPVACPDEACWDVLADGASYTREATWDMRRIPSGVLVQPGVFTIHGELFTFYPDLYFCVDLPIEILDPTAAVPEENGSWGTIKALYR